MSKHWLTKCSNRWDQADPHRAGLEDLARRPEAEALRVWLAHRVLPLVEAQATVFSNKQPGDRKESADFAANAAVLAFIRDLMLVLDTEQT